MQIVGVLAALTISVFALESVFTDFKLSTQIREGILEPVNVSTINGLLGGEVHLPPNVPLIYQCATHDPPKPIVPRDFFLNSIGAIKKIALKAPDPQAPEKPKFLNAGGAKKVEILVGGGRRAKRSMPRELQLGILVRMMEQAAYVFGFESVICDFFPERGSSTVIAHYEIVPTDESGKPTTPRLHSS